jgi:hypothetical protein
MNDEQLNREIEEALATEPSPQFIARVRRQLENEPRASRRLPWIVLPAGLAATALAVGVLVSEPWIWEPSQNVSSEQVVVVPVAPVLEVPEIAKPIQPPAPARITKAVAIQTPPREPELEVLVDPREVAALKRFIHEVQDKKIDPSKLEKLFAAAAAAMDAMPIAGLEPIVIEPLSPAASERGENL